MNTYTLATIILAIFIIIYAYRTPLGEAVQMAKLISEGKKEKLDIKDLDKAIDTMFEELKPTEEKEQ